MLHRRVSRIITMSASLQDIVESYQIAVDVCIRILDGIANSGLGGEIDYYFRLVIIEYQINCLTIGN